MSLHNFKVVRLDGREYDMKEAGITIQSFVPMSPNTITERDTIPFRDGFLDFGTSYGGREIQVNGVFNANNKNYNSIANEIYRIFDSREHFYIITDAEPYKRWKVKYDSNYSFQRIASLGYFQIRFLSPSPYAESIGTTLFPDDYNQILQVNEENFGDPQIQYQFKNTTTFSVWNDGDSVIDPREHYLKLELYCDATDLTIKNLTNGTEWKLYGQLYMYETIVIDGIRTLRDGLSALSSTNRKLITLDKGWNEFQLNGVTSYSSNISFDFRFNYL